VNQHERRDEFTPPPGGPQASPDDRATHSRFDTSGLGQERAAPAAKADLVKRFVAAVIDAVIGIVVNQLPVIGGLIAAPYMLLREVFEFDFMDRRSLGKKVMKLRPVTLDGSPMDLVASAKRNWMFALGGVIAILLWIPFIGWLLVLPIAFLALLIGLVELVLVITDAQGRRLGDKIANTQVIEVAE
jgi:uncharacterized RDD family membrane protein YckC